MDAACDAVQLSWVLRRGLGLLSNLEVEDSPDTFTTRIKAGGVMDVVERYVFLIFETDYRWIANLLREALDALDTSTTRIKAEGVVDVWSGCPCERYSDDCQQHHQGHSC